MQEVTIAEAARRLSMSSDSIRRRISAGEFKARKVNSPHGEMYLVEVPDDAKPDPATPQVDHAPEVEALQQTIAILQTELEARRREVQELHVLLQRAALPPSQTRSTAPEPPHVPWWRKLFVRTKS